MGELVELWVLLVSLVVSLFTWGLYRGSVLLWKACIGLLCPPKTADCRRRQWWVAGLVFASGVTLAAGIFASMRWRSWPALVVAWLAAVAILELAGWTAGRVIERFWANDAPPERYNA
jgi:hypothetical protein